MCEELPLPRDPDRRIIDASRCLTIHNEADSVVPFPDWIDSAAHNSLIGCMRCQAVCPKDRPYQNFMAEPVEFSEEETAFLMAGKPLDEPSLSIIVKAKVINMDQYYGPMARDLSALFASAARP